MCVGVRSGLGYVSAIRLGLGYVPVSWPVQARSSLGLGPIT